MNLHIFFTSLGRFDGSDNQNMKSWFRLFDECCIRAGQGKDDIVKGRLLMLCLSGEALKVVEKMEEDCKEQQTYTSLMNQLLHVFNQSDGQEVNGNEIDQSEGGEKDNLTFQSSGQEEVEHVDHVIEKPLIHNVESRDTFIVKVTDEPGINTTTV